MSNGTIKKEVLASTLKTGRDIRGKDGEATGARQWMSGRHNMSEPSEQLKYNITQKLLDADEKMREFRSWRAGYEKHGGDKDPLIYTSTFLNKVKGDLDQAERLVRDNRVRGQEEVLPQADQSAYASLVETRARRLAKELDPYVGAETLDWADIAETSRREYLGIAERMAELKKKEKGLANKVTAVITIMGFLGGILFLSNNFTGNAIADLATKPPSLVGAGLLIIGLVAGFFWVRSR